MGGGQDTRLVGGRTQITVMSLQMWVCEHGLWAQGARKLPPSGSGLPSYLS